MDITFLVNFIAKYSNGCFKLNLSYLIHYVNIAKIKNKHIKYNDGDIWNIGKAFIIMATTSDSDLNVMGFGTKYSCLDIKFMFNGYDNTSVCGIEYLWLVMQVTNKDENNALAKM